MNQKPISKRYDLEDRTYKFDKRCRDFVNKIPKSIPNRKYADQLSRSSGSVAANYIEANESLSKKDFVNRVKISRKEAKESGLWLRLSEIGEDKSLASEQILLGDESIELVKIFTAIIEKCK